MLLSRPPALVVSNPVFSSWTGGGGGPHGWKKIRWFVEARKNCSGCCCCCCSKVGQGCGPQLQIVLGLFCRQGRRAHRSPPPFVASDHAGQQKEWGRFHVHTKYIYIICIKAIDLGEHKNMKNKYTYDTTVVVYVCQYAFFYFHRVFCR